MTTERARPCDAGAAQVFDALRFRAAPNWIAGRGLRDRQRASRTSPPLQPAIRSKSGLIALALKPSTAICVRPLSAPRERAADSSRPFEPCCEKDRGDLEWTVDSKKNSCELIESLDEERLPGAEDN